MKHMILVTLSGLLALTQARPEGPYNYQRPQIPVQQQPFLGQSQSLNFQPQINLQSLQSSSGFSQFAQGSGHQHNQHQAFPQPNFNQLSSQPFLSQSQSNGGFSQIASQPAQQYGSPNFQSQNNLQSLQSLQGTSQFSQGSGSSHHHGQHQAFPQQSINQFGQSQSSFGQIESGSQNIGLNQASLGQSQSSFNQGGVDLAQPSGRLVTKHIYVHVAPEEQAFNGANSIQQQPLPPAAQTHYKIIFIKAPTDQAQQYAAQQAAAAQRVEEKTLVYVLVKKPDEPEVIGSSSSAIQPSKPEVYFIKYKTNKNGNIGSSLATSDLSASSGSSQSVLNNLGGTINSGESSSSLFSGGLQGPSPKYGPPGYQK